MLTLKQHAYQWIRTKLVSGDMPAGCRLSDDALAKEIGISRSPVREAISQLASEGLVECRPRCGAFVKVPSREELEELYEVRIALESFAAGKAAMFAGDDEIAELERLHQELLATVNACRRRPGKVADRALTDRFLAGDMKFHLQILRAGGNKRLCSLVDDCRIFIQVFGHVPIEHDARLMEDSAQQHASILAAIHRRDSQAARDLTMSHIAMAGKLVLDKYQGNAPSLARA